MGVCSKLFAKVTAENSVSTEEEKEEEEDGENLTECSCYGRVRVNEWMPHLIVRSFARDQKLKTECKASVVWVCGCELASLAG